MSRNRQQSRSRDIDLEYADRPWRPAIGVEMIERQDVLHIARPRPVQLPGPVEVYRAIGRPPLEWEAWLIIEARQRERARELTILKGLV